MATTTDVPMAGSTEKRPPTQSQKPSAIESLNAPYRRAVRACGHLPNEQSAMTLYLVTRSLDAKGTGQTRWAVRWKRP